MQENNQNVVNGEEVIDPRRYEMGSDDCALVVMAAGCCYMGSGGVAAVGAGFLYSYLGMGAALDIGLGAPIVSTAICASTTFFAMKGYRKCCPRELDKEETPLIPPPSMTMSKNH